MKKTKVLAAVLTALCMCGAYLPSVPEVELSASAANRIDSGTCGSNLTWTFDSDGTLTISGDGKMVENTGDLSYSAHSSEIQHVKIESGVTSIGGGAFSNYPLTSVEIPSSVTSIGGGAFTNCPLTSVRIPDGVTNIGSGAFTSCPLTSVDIPDSVISIGNGAFAGCASLTSVEIGKNLGWIEAQTFAGCSNLTSFTIKNPECSFNGEIFASAGTVTIYGYQNSTAQKYAGEHGCSFVILPPESGIQQGDANSDGKVDILDVIAVNKALLGKGTLTAEQLKAIDFNSNNKPDAEESLRLLKFIVGLIESF